MADAAQQARRRARQGAAAWGGVLLVLALLAAVLGQHPRRALDLRVYLTAAERFLEATALYREADGAMPFKYAPAVAWLFTPLLLLPARVAGALWNLGSVAALAATVGLLRRFEPAGLPGGRALFAAALAALVLGHSLHLDLLYGQVDLVMMLLLVASATYAEREQPIPSGACFALAVLLKPPAAIFALYLLRQRRLHALTAAALAGVLLWAPVLLRYGPQGALELLHAWSALVARTTAPWALGHNVQGLPTLLLGLGWEGPADPSQRAMMLAQVLAIALFTGGFLLGARERGAALALACLGAALLSPLAWRANYVLAFPLLWRAFILPPGRWRTLGLALAAALALLPLVHLSGLLSPAQAMQWLLLRPYAWLFSLLALWAVLMPPTARRSRRRADAGGAAGGGTGPAGVGGGVGGARAARRVGRASG